MSISNSLDFRRGPRLEPADLLELYCEREPDDQLLRASSAAASLDAPLLELPWPHRDRREAILTAIHRGETADAAQLAEGWLEAAAIEAEAASGAAAGPAALGLAAALEVFSAQRENRGEYSAAAQALAAALRLHSRRAAAPFHGVLLRRAATLLAALGGVGASRLVAAEALRLAIEAGDDLAAAYSLGAAARMAALAQDRPAALASIAAARRFLPDGEPLLRFSLFQVETNSLIATGRLEEAELALESAARALAEASASLPENYLLWTRARLRQAQGRHHEAATLLATAAEAGRHSQEPLNRVLIALDLAESLAALGRSEELETLKQALKAERLDSVEGGAVFAAAAERLFGDAA